MTKDFLRKAFLRKRSDLSVEEIDTASQLIEKNLQRYLSDKFIRNIHIFLPQRGKNEINTWNIITAFRETFSHIDIAVPFVMPGTRELRHFVLTDTTRLLENRWGIPEPDPLTSRQIQPEMLDAILLPLLAFDKRGYRVGYGGGFYDRFLAQCRADVYKIGLSLFSPIEIIEDVNCFDIKMDACILPLEITQWRNFETSNY